MNKLRGAAQAVVQCFDTHGFVLEYRIKALRDALRDALAEPDEVLAEREACAEVLVGKIKRHEQIAQECALRGEYAEVTVLRSTAQKLSECVAEIRARGQE